MYRKEKEKHKEEKTLIVNRSFNTSQGRKTARGVKVVDARLRKDQRNAKFKAKRNKGSRGGVAAKAPKAKKGGRGKSTGKKRCNIYCLLINNLIELIHSIYYV